jgi:hypothetical protein
MISQSVEDSLKEAELNLRNALAFAARSERPFVAKTIAGLISEIDTMLHADRYFDTIDNLIREDE